ncbi:beta/gamma crystallin-related protein [Rubrivivax sp. RP6-9]|uniref:beta/gamma crystallin-related protein n=1 Tax=Rubrivivax sp. RP6-9 TaxID=3415750 RepID=UPI003CC5091D
MLTTLLLALAGGAAAQVVFYENEDFGGRSLRVDDAEPSFGDRGFNDRASSIRVDGGRWQVCQHSNYGGQCVELRPGSYPTLAAMGMQDRVSSVRRLSEARQEQREEERAVRDERMGRDDRYAIHDGQRSDPRWRRRPDERLYEANVLSARAVRGPAEQRCWMERQDVEERRSDARVPGAVIGAVLGGVLGHQIGSGSGRDLATVGGVVAGAAVGSQVGRAQQGPQVATQDVRRCADAPGPRPTDYWDVSYRFRGDNHRVQLREAPGPTITVNRRGEPRE